MFNTPHPPSKQSTMRAMFLGTCAGPPLSPSAATGCAPLRQGLRCARTCPREQPTNYRLLDRGTAVSISSFLPRLPTGIGNPPRGPAIGYPAIAVGRIGSPAESGEAPRQVLGIIMDRASGWGPSGRAPEAGMLFRLTRMGPTFQTKSKGHREVHRTRWSPSAGVCLCGGVAQTL